MRVEDLIERFDRWLREDEDSRYYGGPTIPATKLNRDEIAATRSLLRSQQDRIEALEAGLAEIAQWAEAYPVPVFPEPDLDLVATILLKAGQREQIDRMHAAWARHLTSGIGKIARSTLTSDPTL